MTWPAWRLLLAMLRRCFCLRPFSRKSSRCSPWRVRCGWPPSGSRQGLGGRNLGAAILLTVATLTRVVPLAALAIPLFLIFGVEHGFAMRTVVRAARVLLIAAALPFLLTPDVPRAAGRAGGMPLLRIARGVLPLSGNVAAVMPFILVLTPTPIAALLTLGRRK